MKCQAEIGQVVHYVTRSRECRAALVVKVVDGEFGLMNLRIYSDIDDLYAPSLVRAVPPDPSEDPEPGTWHGIAKVTE